MQTLAVVALYFFTAFGPGFVLGLLMANRLYGRGKPFYMDIHKEKIKQAEAYNAQWHPTQERWQKN